MTTYKQITRISLGEEAFAIIKETQQGKFELYEIPAYGGEEIFSGIFDDFKSAEKEGRSWT